MWVGIENEPPYLAGQVVVQPGQPLPPGHVVLGTDKALLPNGSSAVAVKKIKLADLGGFAARDLRVLPVKFDSAGVRRRDFLDAVTSMTQDKMPGGGLQLEGPPTTLKVLKSLASRSLTPVTDHERWIRSSEISKSDRSIYEMEVLARVIEAFVMVDQVNLPNLKGGQLLLRRWQLIKEAHRICPTQPDYSASDHFMGWELDSGVVQSLTKHVSEQLRDQAAIAKESRKAKEELSYRNQHGGGRGRGRGRGKNAPADDP